MPLVLFLVAKNTLKVMLKSDVNIRELGKLTAENEGR
jgi:hypothetical protein